jgi:tetratricopeptide (TPR) repeat protein
MSKRSDRSKRKQQTGLTGSVLTKYGIQAFKQANYDEAIRLWQQARSHSTVSAKLPAALAEAYFRRALSKFMPNLADLQQATQLNPTDSRYRYHVALAHHRLGQLALAEPIYQQLLAESPPFERAAVPLALLRLEQKKTPVNNLVRDHLSQDNKTWLAILEAFSRKKAAPTRPDFVDDSLDPVWQGLLAMVLGDQTTARQKLQSALALPNQLPALLQGLAHYYLGVLAAAGNEYDQALEQWQAAWFNGLNIPHLRQNLSGLLYHKAVAELEAGRPATALDLLAKFKDLELLDKKLAKLYRQLNLEMGYAASKRGNWGQALFYWEVARDEGDDSRKLIMNLALGYQHLEDYHEAADAWRTLLRRRPRKATHPDALSNEQVARIWQIVAENYSKAGYYEEAIKTYKNAVKWAPDNLDMRLMLVDVLQTEGRWQAAKNELNRILEQEPDYVPALVRLAEIYADDYFPNNAKTILRRVLDLEPQNPIARQQLAHLHINQGDLLSRWGNHSRAIEVYQEGLSLVPESQKLHIAIGGTYANQGDFDEAGRYFEQALAINPNDIATLYTIFLVWLEHDLEPYLSQSLDRLKAVAGTVPSNLFLDLVRRCVDLEQDDYAKLLLEYIETQYPDDEKALVEVALHYADRDEEKHAISILRQILKNNPDHAEASLRLGSIYYKIGQTRLAHRHWDRAEQQARQENDQILLYDLKLAKDVWVHGKTLPQNLFELLQEMPPALRKQMLEQLPPDMANLLNMDPELLELMMGFNFMDDFEYDEDDYDYDY